MSKTNGYVMYEGPSAINGAPIIAVITGLATASQNSKTGAMAQLYILDASAKPSEAAKNGADESVCGSCIHRLIPGIKKRSCYVNLGHGPRAVYDGYQRGIYPAWNGSTFDVPVRFGAYGDPAALPIELAEKIAKAAPRGRTGYSHQFASMPQELAERWARLVMMSADSEDDVSFAKRIGARFFRVLPKGADVSRAALGKGAILCPASEEAGKRVTCSDCRLCDGASIGDKRASIVIPAHGSGAKNFAGGVA